MSSIMRWFLVYPSEEPGLDPIERAARNRNLVGTVGLALFLMGFGSIAWAAKGFWLNAIVCGLAAYIVGVLIGFLFGVPRSNSQDSTEKASEASPGDPGAGRKLVSVNTNLEQISDWLTKIIVGVGLVEMKTIPVRLVSIGAFIKPFLGNTAASQVFAVQILLYFWSFGFLSGFISTRVFLTKVISDADASATGTLSAALKTQVQSTPPVAKLTPSDSPPAPDTKTVSAANEIARTPLAALNSPDDIAAWGQSQMALGNYSQAAEAFKKALQANPGDIKSHLNLGICYYSMPGVLVQAAISELLAALTLITPQTDLITVGAIYENLAAAYLYMDAPGGFQTALDYAAKALTVPESNQARVYFYIAAANGQRHQWLQKQNAGQDRIADARANALKAARQAVALDPNMRARLAELAKDPKSVDNDLVSLADDPDFQEIIKSDSAATN